MTQFRDPFDPFVRPARASAEPWRLGLGIVIVVFIYIMTLLSFDRVLGALTGAPAPSVAATANSGWAMIYVLWTFAGMAMGAILAAVIVHNRPARTLFGPRNLVIYDFVVAAYVTFGIQAVMLVFWFVTTDTVPHLRFDQWLAFLPLALAMIALQTGAEEMLFRGYLMQQLAARFQSPWAWGVLPSALFAALHYDPGIDGLTAFVLLAAIGIIALVTVDLTAVTGSLGAAWGFHFAFNTTGMLILAPKGPLAGLALFVGPRTPETLGWQILADVLAILVCWSLIRRRLAR